MSTQETKLDKRLFARELTKQSYMISQIQAWTRETINHMATPGSEVHELLGEIAEHKIAGSQKLRMNVLYAVTDENRAVMIEKLREFGFIVNVYDEDDIIIDLIGFKVPEKEETVYLHQLELTFADIAKEFEES